MELKKTTFLILRRHRQKKQKKSALSQRSKKAAMVCLAGIFLVLAAGVFSSAVLFTGLLADLPSLEQIPVLLNAENGQLLQPTRLYDRSGTQVLLTLENPGIPQSYLSLDAEQSQSLPPRLVQMTIALEDPDFWRHPGFDWQHLTSPAPATLAEQLADRLLLSDKPQGLKRTLQMRLLAAQLVSQYNRTQVLEWYLNSAYYGHLAYGAESAARLYFDKSASQLDITETALLVGLAQTPALNPLDSPAAARDRHHEVLGQLLDAGAISQLEYEQALTQPLQFRTESIDKTSSARAFTHIVLDRLAAEIDIHRIEMGGLEIITTLDGDLQAQLDCALQTQLQQLGQQDKTLPGCEAARLLPTLPPAAMELPEGVLASALVLDPSNGQVLAMLGKTGLEGESSSISDLQPGSMLSPFIALAGFSRGFSPSSLVWDIPDSMPEELNENLNLNDKYHGPLRLRQALVNDYLPSIAHLMQQLTPETVWKLTAPLGLSDINSENNSMNILFEGGNVNALELAWAYSPFASAGVQTGQDTGGSSLQPVLVLSINDVDGRIWMEEPAIESRAVLSEQIAYLVHDVLADPLTRRESLGYPNALEVGRPSAAKVGRADQGKQIWTTGYTPQRLVQTWFGLPEDTDCEDCSLDVRIAAGLWHALMQYSSQELPTEDWTVPSGITSRQVCDPSGLLPTLDCPNVVSEIFLEGSEPTAYDNLYRVYTINRETELLATVFTPLELVEERTYLVIPDKALSWAQQNEISLPPTTYDVIQAPQATSECYISAPTLFAYINGQVDIKGTAAGEGFASYRLQIGKGLNPENWQQVGSEQTASVQDGILAAWDTTAQEDGLYALRLVVQRQEQEVATAITQVTVDNTPPEVRLLYPQDGQKLSLPSTGEINLQVQASDNTGVDHVEWFIDGRKIDEQSDAPYTTAWQASPGTHTLAVTAFDLAGNSRESEEIEVQITRKAE